MPRQQKETRSRIKSKRVITPPASSQDPSEPKQNTRDRKKEDAAGSLDYQKKLTKEPFTK